MCDTVNSPITVGGLTLKNRIVFAPTSMGLKEEEYLERIRGLAAGGTGLIVIGDVPVLKTAPRSLYSRKGFAFYQRVASAAHENGAKVSAQLHVSDSNIMGMLRYIPGVLTGRISREEMRPLLNGQVGSYITKLPVRKIRKIIEGFGASAALAQKAGFDMIQIHGDRMCGSFSSAIFNRRKDEYGGSVKNRMRFALEAVRAVRRQVPDMPVDYKLAVRQEHPHYGNAGVLVEELSEAVPMLVEAGVDSFHVTLANHGALTDTIPPADHPYFKEEGCFLKFCDEVKRYTDRPVCGVGGLVTPDFVERQLKSGRIDMAAMSRGLLAEPGWVNKTLGKDTEPFKRCIRCNKACLGGMQRHEGVSCIYDKNKKTKGENEDD